MSIKLPDAQELTLRAMTMSVEAIESRYQLELTIALYWAEYQDLLTQLFTSVGIRHNPSSLFSLERITLLMIREIMTERLLENADQLIGESDHDEVMERLMITRDRDSIRHDPYTHATINGLCRYIDYRLSLAGSQSVAVRQHVSQMYTIAGRRETNPSRLLRENTNRREFSHATITPRAFRDLPQLLAEIFSRYLDVTDTEAGTENTLTAAQIAETATNVALSFRAESLPR